MSWQKPHGVYFIFLSFLFFISPYRWRKGTFPMELLTGIVSIKNFHWNNSISTKLEKEERTYNLNPYLNPSILFYFLFPLLILSVYFLGSIFLILTVSAFVVFDVRVKERIGE